MERLNWRTFIFTRMACGKSRAWCDSMHPRIPLMSPLQSLTCKTHDYFEAEYRDMAGIMTAMGPRTSRYSNLTLKEQSMKFLILS